jgi:hypothetical protein
MRYHPGMHSPTPNRLAPDFAASDRLSGDVLTPTRYYGQHGFLAGHDGVCGMLFVRGVGIQKKWVDKLSATAPLIAEYLRISISD